NADAARDGAAHRAHRGRHHRGGRNDAVSQEPADPDPAWIAFRMSLERLIGVPLYQYKEPQMKRRLAGIMTRRGFAGWAEFTRAVAADPALLAVVRDTLTINVSEFFRQPDRFEALQRDILP